MRDRRRQMKTFRFEVHDAQPNRCEVTIQAESREALLQLIDDVGLDELINDPDANQCTAVWGEDIHQPLYAIVDDYIEEVKQ
jgi:hypothetical protein